MRRAIEYKYIVAIIYACVLFLDRLDLTIVNITLPTLAHYFHLPITQTQWVTNSFLFALAIIIPVSGWLGDKYGAKKIFIIATAIFGFSSLLCAFSPDLLFMVIMRFVQGLGGGAIIPVGMTMLYRAFPPAEYASITSFTFLPSLVAPAVAPAIGGLITHYFGWQWVFIFAVPICFIVVVLSIFILREEKQQQASALDVGGFIYSALSLILLLYSLSLIGENGFDLLTNIYLLATALFVFLFICHEKTAAHPLINLKLFKNKLFLQANLVQIAFQSCHFGSIFLVGMYLQIGVGMSALATGFIMGMQAVGAICMSRYSVKLFNWVGPGTPVVIGFIGISIFTLSILFVTDKHMVIAGAIILFLRGIFSGLCGTPIQTISVLGIAKQDISSSNAIFNAGRQVSISLGVALSSLLIAYGLKFNHAHAVFYYAFFMIPIVALIGIIIALTIDNQQVTAATQLEVTTCDLK